MEELENILGQAIPSFRPVTGQVITEESGDEELSPAAKIARNMTTYYSNPWALVEDKCIYTLEETNLLDPVKPFPNYPWLQEIAAQWQSEPLLALFKSRRMTCTWLFVFLHLWLAMFREGAAIFFVSDKEEKSDELVKRAAFIYNHIPNDMILKPEGKYTYCNLKFPGLNSRIQGVAQGADQLRQYSATAILMDEFAFWDRARETFQASKPTIDGGGKITLISSPREGFFKELVFDLVR